jgi:hypothetical protein
VEASEADFQRHATGALLTLAAMCALIAGATFALLRRYSIT